MPVLLAIALAAPTIAQMKDVRRVLIVATSSPTDPRLAAQRRMLAGWRDGGAQRDLSVVEIVGSTVSGATDPAPALRRRYKISTAFSAILIGKDGGVKLRSAEPLTAEALAGTIDAMPMRKSGRR